MLKRNYSELPEVKLRSRVTIRDKEESQVVAGSILDVLGLVAKLQMKLEVQVACISPAYVDRLSWVVE